MGDRNAAKYCAFAGKQPTCTGKLPQTQGRYVFSGNGWGAFQPPPQLIDSFFAVAVSGTWLFDGKGSVSRNLNLSFFGFTFPYQDSGTYQVNPD